MAQPKQIHRLNAITLTYTFVDQDDNPIDISGADSHVCLLKPPPGNACRSITAAYVPTSNKNKVTVTYATTDAPGLWGAEFRAVYNSGPDITGDAIGFVVVANEDDLGTIDSPIVE